MPSPRAVELGVAGAPSLVRVAAPGWDGVSVDWRVLRIGGADAWEITATVRNEGDGPRSLVADGALLGRLVGDGWHGRWFTSAWGAEFTPAEGGLPIAIGVDRGRSSLGVHPWLELTGARGAVIVSPAWSGNWGIDVAADGTVVAGASGIGVDLAAGETVRLPSVVVAVGPDAEAAAVSLSAAIGRQWTPRSAASDRVPTEWNHWWPFEDVGIDERTVLDNAALAAAAGLEVVTVDAGWFGTAERGSDWQHERGDWHLVNTARFPRGLGALADDVRALGPGFGIWIEPEAVGRSARLRVEHPEIVARGEATAGSTSVSLDPDDPGFLGYVCLGSPGGREHVARSLDTLVGDTGAVWVKLDFNVDPGAGCTRTDHGHGAGDGLLRHYEGLYAVLDGFRAAHPEVVLEACASGGLRIDLELARHVHCLFLSDPDWTEHHSQVLWGASRMLPPVAMLHWSWSQWRGEHPQQRRDMAAVAPDEFTGMLHAAMTQRFGVSLDLPALPPALRERLAQAVALYRSTVAEFVRDGVLHRIGAQPLHDGGGERTPAVQLVLADGRRLVIAWSLDAARGIELALPADGRHRVTDLLGAESCTTGGDLLLRGAAAWSWLWLVEPI